MAEEKSDCTCCKWLGWVLVIFGILYLLADFNVMPFGVSWWTALFIVLGIKWICK